MEWSIARYCFKEPDLKLNAQRVYTRMALDGNTRYCFLERHCTNKDITPDSTMEEGIAACDKKYGHERWTNVKFADQPKVHGDSYNTTEDADYWGMVACAMGNFHCDIIYCQETYCKMPEYIEAFGQYLGEDVGDHK